MKSYPRKITLLSLLLCTLTKSCLGSGDDSSVDSDDDSSVDYENNQTITSSQLQKERKKAADALSKKNTFDDKLVIDGLTLDIKKKPDCYAILSLICTGTVATCALRNKLGKDNSISKRLKIIEDEIGGLNVADPYTLQFIAQKIHSVITSYRDSKPDEDMTALNLGTVFRLWTIPKFAWSLRGEYIDMDTQMKLWGGAAGAQVKKILAYADDLIKYQTLRARALSTDGLEAKLMPGGANIIYSSFVKIFNRRYPVLSDANAPKLDLKSFDYKYPTQTTHGQIFVIVLDVLIGFLIWKFIEKVLLKKRKNVKEDDKDEDEDDEE